MNVILALVFLFASTAFADPKAVVFDCDGVIVETEPVKFEAWRQALHAAKIEFTRAEYVPLVGQDNEAMLARIAEIKHVPPDERLIAEKEKIYARLQKRGVPLRSATVRLIRHLAAHKAELGIKLGLASGGYRSEILENLKQARLVGLFDVILSGHDDLGDFDDPTGTNKPKPYIYQKMAKSLGVEPKDLVVFEDSAAGVEAASRAGSTVYAVPNDFTKAQDFKLAREVLTLTEAPEPTLARLFPKRPKGPSK